jgi:cell division protein FtsI/penicillin-binding protein 2
VEQKIVKGQHEQLNDGVRMKPYIVEKVVDANGLSIGDYGSKTLGSVVSASTARKMREMMLGVAAPGGTARRAAIKGYSIAGKTGTAQKVINGHYADGLYVATFCGIVPATAPELVILISLDFNTRARYHQGGNSAGPVFKRLALTALRYLEVAPDKPEEIEESDDDEYESIKSSALNLP